MATLPLHEFMKSHWGMAGKHVTPEAFDMMRRIVTTQLFGPKGNDEVRA